MEFFYHIQYRVIELNSQATANVFSPSFNKGKNGIFDLISLQEITCQSRHGNEWKDLFLFLKNVSVVVNTSTLLRVFLSFVIVEIVFLNI